MKEHKKNNANGITLIALVISIIVMLILAGVSLNAVVGENGVLTQAQNATMKSKFATYLEELELNKVDKMIEDGIYDELCLNIPNGSIELQKYIPSLPDDELDDFEIIAGYLVYLGDNQYYKEAAIGLGMKDKNDQVLYDAIGKEFAYYVSTWENAKATGKVPAAKLNNFNIRDGVGMNEFREYAGIPEGKYDNEFQLDFGILSYIGTNEDRLMLLANSQTLRGYIADGILKLANYVAPEEGSIATTTDGLKVISDWIIEDAGTDGAIKLISIIGYTGNQTVITIPDTFNVTSGSTTTIYKVVSVKGDGTNNIFKAAGSTNVAVQKVTVAKGISKIENKGLANLGKNIQCHVLYVGKDLTLGNDKSNSNILGYEGIEGTCGSFTFVVPSTGNYTFKLWGASGGSGADTYSITRGSESGLGGYSQGTVALNENDKIYCYIGGRGLLGSSDLEDGSGGYNGGGNGEYLGAPGYGGGGATDIRFGGTAVNESNDYRILVAGGGGGADNGPNGARGVGTFSHDDGTGGYGGGTVNQLDANGKVDKTQWSGLTGAQDGVYNTIGAKKVYDDVDVTYNWAAQPGAWILKNGEYVPTGYKLFQAQYGGEVLNVHVSVPHYDMPGGGGGYYGGFASCYNNGGGGGGSAYADIEGRLKQVTNIQGYGGPENGEGAEMKGQFGNGKIIISK